MIVNIDNDGNILIGNDTASTTAVQFLLFLLSQLKDSQFADFDYHQNSAYKNIQYDRETHVLSWEKWGQSETYSMTTTDLQEYAAQCVTQVAVDYATSAQVQELKSLVQALPDAQQFEALAKSVELEPLAKSTELASLATATDLEPLAKSSELTPLATSADLQPMAKSSELQVLATAAQIDALPSHDDIEALASKADVKRVEDMLVQAKNRATISAIGSMVSTGASLVAASKGASSTDSAQKNHSLEITEDA